MGEIGNPVWPMQQIQIEVISPEASEARLTGPRDAVSRHMARPHLGDQEHAIARPMNSSEPYISAVSISVIPSERPVRSASSSSATGCLPFPRPAEPWPSAGTMVPSRNLTVRPAPVEAAPVAASRANAPDEVTNEPSAAQSPLNSRRFSSLVFLPFTILSLLLSADPAWS